MEHAGSIALDVLSNPENSNIPSGLNNPNDTNKIYG